MRRRRQARAGRASTVSGRPRRLFFLSPLILDLPKGARTGIWRGLRLRSWTASGKGRRVGEGRPGRSRISPPLRPAQAFRRPAASPSLASSRGRRRCSGCGAASPGPARRWERRGTAGGRGRKGPDSASATFPRSARGPSRASPALVRRAIAKARLAAGKTGQASSFGCSRRGLTGCPKPRNAAPSSTFPGCLHQAGRA